MNEEVSMMGCLFGTMAYHTMDELEYFMDQLRAKEPEPTVLTIHAALRHAQKSGIFSLEESEAISIILRKLKESAA